MSKKYISGDWHLRHENIFRFRSKSWGFYRDFSDEMEHRMWILGHAEQLLTKGDTLYLLGDIHFKESTFEDVKNLPGRKILLKGNHEIPKSPLYDKTYDQTHGLMKHKGVWLSHAPIHPRELRGKYNFHGHVHHDSIPDTRYVNCSVDGLMHVFGQPIVAWDDLMDYVRGRNKDYVETEEVRKL